MEDNVIKTCEACAEEYQVPEDCEICPICEGELNDYDPTPWCSCCGAMKKANCDCGPIADND